MNADGTNNIQLTGIGTNNDYADWSPNGSKLAFHSDRTANFEIWTMNADGSDQTNITNSSGYFRFTPSWSPNGAYIAYTVVVNGLYKIAKMNADGTNSGYVADDAFNNFNAAWKPNSTDVSQTLYPFAPSFSSPINLTFKHIYCSSTQV